jgi:tRNA threonylcarbamoyladenosine biosynthesis protein TsaB
MSEARPVLAFDFGSPTASAALAAAGVPLAARVEARDGAGDLLRLISAVLADAGVAPHELGGAVAVAGPGSFTGLRVACATALALGQAWPLAIGGVSTLTALAWSAPAEVQRVVAVVDALRGEWFVQSFGAADARGSRSAEEAPRLWRPGDPSAAAGVLGELSDLGDLSDLSHLVIGFDAERFAATAGSAAPRLVPLALAPAIAAAASRPDWIWDPAPLTRPFYLRAPATTRPRA